MNCATPSYFPDEIKPLKPTQSSTGLLHVFSQESEGAKYPEVHQSYGHEDFLTASLKCDQGIPVAPIHVWLNFHSL